MRAQRVSCAARRSSCATRQPPRVPPVVELLVHAHPEPRLPVPSHLLRRRRRRPRQRRLELLPQPLRLCRSLCRRRLELLPQPLRLRLRLCRRRLELLPQPLRLCRRLCRVRLRRRRLALPPRLRSRLFGAELLRVVKMSDRLSIRADG
jgi:hypothetical protein